MFQENEVITLLCGCATALFILANYKKIRRIPSYRLFLLSFFIYFIGWISTVAEGLCWYAFFNLTEHVCYLLSSMYMFAWCRSLSPRKRRTP